MLHGCGESDLCSDKNSAEFCTVITSVHEESIASEERSLYAKLGYEFKRTT